MGEGELHDIAIRLHGASIRLLRMLRTGDGAGGISAPRLSALSSLVAGGPASLADLAEAEQVRPPTMSRIVETLVEAGLATRAPAPGDRRSVRIAATAKGERLMIDGRDRRIKLLTARLAKLADSELRALARGVEILVRATR
jgi:DNA-binding MarR family transcriptional regulator